MRRCETCDQDYAVVAGVPDQECPHCGAVARTERVRAVSAGGRVDPVTAAGAAWRLFFTEYPRLLGVVLLPFAIEIIAVLAFLQYASGAGLQLPTGFGEVPEDPAESMRLLGILVPLTFIMYAARMFAWGLVASHARSILLPEAPALQLGRLLPAYAGLALLLTLLYIVGAVLFVVPFLIVFHWFLFAPAAASDGLDMGQSLDASRRFARERRTYGFTALVLLVLVGALVVAGILGLFIAMGLSALGVPESHVAELGSSLAHWLVLPLVPLFPAAYWFLAQTVPAEAAAPVVVAVGASAADRFRTTKCPECRTLVPYTTTGKSVDIECPVCGKKGRVH